MADREPLQSIPRIVSVTLPQRAGVLRAGAVRPAIVTSVADPIAWTLNLCVFLEAGDVQGKNSGDTFWIGAIAFTDQDLKDPANWGRWWLGQ
jgi:hypothetical protein